MARKAIFIGSVLFLLSILILFHSVQAKPILIILTDIGGDPDDEQSLVRLLVYANEFRIKGIILKHWKSYGDEGFTPQEQYQLTKSYINAYGNVVGNLSRHKSGYPSKSYLLSIIKRGGVNIPCTLGNSSVSNIMNKVIGRGKDTEGSDWIIQVVDNAGNSRVNIAAWGGTSDLAQALWKVKNTRSSTQIKEFVKKLRVYSIEDQDDAGHWICDNFSDIFYIYAHARDDVIIHGSYRGMYLGGDETLTSASWVRNHVSSGHGALGNKYPMSTYTKPNPYGCLKEGDTPSWFYFLENGLNNPSHPNYGGWGGRFSKRGSFYQDAKDRVDGEYSGRATVWRWREDYQNDFAARMDWCVKSYSSANHNPHAEISGSTNLTVNSGELVTLSAAGSTDPDGNSLSFEWIYYPRVGSFSGSFTLPDKRGETISFYAPYVSSRKTMHIILRVKDNGNPPLVSYKRIILTINPGETKYSIDGKINYFHNENPVGNVRIVLSGGANLSCYSSSNGYFKFDNLNPNETYSFRPFKSAGEDVGELSILGFDAALAARASLNLITLTSQQTVAADVDNDGKITLMDATHIARYAVGLPHLSESHVAEWEFLPAHREISALSKNCHDQNFQAIILGNVHGNWSANNSGLPKAINLTSRKPIEVHQREIFSVPLNFEQTDSLFSFDLQIKFDNSLLRFADIQPPAEFSNFQIFLSEQSEGEIKICAYSPIPARKPEKPIALRFEVISSSVERSEIVFSKIVINQSKCSSQSQRLVFVDHEQLLPQNYALHQAFPNPYQFQGNLAINFSLPRDNEVEFFIFNTLGQIVRHFEKVDMPAGEHRILWNGKNDAGEFVSPGIYFYQMKAGRFSAVKKLLIVR